MNNKQLEKITVKELETMIQSAEWFRTHRPDPKARELYELKERTYAQDYYVKTGNWYHRQGNKSRKENNGN